MVNEAVLTFVGRLTRATDFTATTFPRTNLTSQLCGLRLGLAGTFCCLPLLSFDFRLRSLYRDSYLSLSLPLALFLKV